MPAEATVGPLRVRVDAARAAEFAREIGLEGGREIAPLSYPALWLAEPAVHDEIARICAEADCAPVHEQQSFAYEAPLRIGSEYELLVTMRREETPPRLVVEARLTAPGGSLAGKFETLLRLVPCAALRRNDAA